MSDSMAIPYPRSCLVCKSDDVAVTSSAAGAGFWNRGLPVFTCRKCGSYWTATGAEMREGCEWERRT